VESGAASQKPKVPLGKPAGFSEKSHRLARWFFRLRVGFPLISIVQVEKFLLWQLPGFQFGKILSAITMS